MTGGMMFKGTPGPWSLLQSPSNTKRYFVVDSGGSCISCDDEYSSDDANLIAAAPDLLEALMLGYEGIMQYDGQKKLKEIMRAAIAKALGDQK